MILWICFPQKLLPFHPLSNCSGLYTPSTDFLELMQLIQGTHGSFVSFWSLSVPIHDSISLAHVSSVEQEVMLHFLGKNKREFPIIPHYLQANPSNMRAMGAQGNHHLILAELEIGKLRPEK